MVAGHDQMWDLPAGAARAGPRLSLSRRPASMDDLVTRGGMVLDGTGSDAAREDLAVRDSRITAIASHHGHTGARPGRVLRRGPSGVA